MPTTIEEDEESQGFLIVGITQNGKTFRPRNWAERLAGVSSAFCEGSHLAYSPDVWPITTDGVMGVIVNGALRKKNRRCYDFLLNFAHDNDLEVRLVCKSD